VPVFFFDYVHSAMKYVPLLGGHCQDANRNQTWMCHIGGIPLN
jgi:hypothetical protein